MKHFLIIGAAALASACTPAKHVYKITFRNGDVDYYGLINKTLIL